MFSAPTTSSNSARWIRLAGCSRATENQYPARCLQLAGYLLDRKQSGGIERGHIAKTQDDDRRQRVEILGDYGELSVAPNRNGPWMRKIVT